MAKFKKGDYVFTTTDERGMAYGIRHDMPYVQVTDSDNAVFYDDDGDLRERPGCYYTVARSGSEHQTGQSAGRKDDGGKLDMNLLDDMPRAIKAVVEVMQWAVTDKKPVPYERGSWLGVHADRYRAAIKRHDRAACEQTLGSTTEARFQRDSETHLLHLAHMACSAMMALENTLRELESK